MNPTTAGGDNLSKRLQLRFGWKEEEVERRLEQASIVWWKRILRFVISKFAVGAFDLDHAMIRDVCRCTSLNEVEESIDEAHYRGTINPNFWRQIFGLRVSGRKLFAIATECFPQR